MVELGVQGALVLLCALPRADVAGNVGSADHRTCRIMQGRNRKRSVNQCSIFAAADGFVMVDALAAANALQVIQLLVPTIGWNDQCNRPSDNLFGCIAENAFCPLVPARDYTTEIGAYDRVIGRLDQRNQALGSLFRLLALGDVAADPEPSHGLTSRTANGANVDGDPVLLVNDVLA